VKSRKHIPPRFAQQLLLLFLRRDLAEEVQGDLEENYYAMVQKQPTWRARLNYYYQVFHYLRPFAIGKTSQYLTRLDMYSSYFKIGYRNLFRNKGYSAINIGGLAVGMAVAILISLWIFDEMTFNQYHDNYPKLTQILQNQTFNGARGTQEAIPRPLEFAIRSNFSSDIPGISMSTWTGGHILSFGEQKISKMGNFVQVDFPDMISVRMLKGSPRVLNDPTTILLSASTAKALFGDVDPLNQTIRLNNLHDLKVMGVYEDIPYNSDFRELEFLGSWDLHVNSNEWVKNAADRWGNNSFQLFVQLGDKTSTAGFSAKIKDLKKVDPNETQFNPEFFAHPMEDWRLRNSFKNGVNVGGAIELVWLFAIIGAFVLLLACINFMNLSTARSEKRAKEVGIRMTIGSLRNQLIQQFLSESFLIVLIAFVMAIVLVALSLPWFNELANKKMNIPWSWPAFWGASGAFIVVTSLLAGSYPALYLSSFQPVKVLKGTFRTGKLATVPRKVLVVLQFTVSVTLIIGTIIVYRQIQFTKDRPVGYDSQGLVMIEMKSREFEGKFESLRTELLQVGAVEEMSESSSPITGIWSNNGGFDWEGKDPDLQAEFATIWTSHEYGKTLRWQIVQGRDFSRDFPSDSMSIVLNEAATKFMSIPNPVGMKVKWNDEELTVIGVVKDVIAQSPYRPVKQAVYLVSDRFTSWLNLRLNPDKSVSECLALAETVFKKQVPSSPFEYEFVDVEYAKKFEGEVRVGKLASFFASLAVLISCLGIFGLASFVAEQRTKEIGIRKVLGASVVNLWRMLSTDFVVLVIISCCIAIPIAYYFLAQWLEKYEYRTEISWWIMGIAVAATLTVTLVTVSFQAIKAALMSPVKSLRSE
jgi:ABC-type antimicrobial peptide transport system permease subunit